MAADDLPGWALRLRIERRNRLWSQRELARELTGVAGEHPHLPSAESIVRRIKAYEAGRNQPDEPYRTLLCRVFGLSEAELFDSPDMPLPALTLPSLVPTPEMYERITKVIGEPQRVDLETIEWLERCLAEHRRAEDTLGSRPLMPVVRAQLATVTDLARGTSGPLGDRMVSMVAQYAQFLAWMCQDSRDLAAALAWYDRSHSWALEAGDAALAATTLNMRAHLAWSVGDPQRCVRLAEASRWHDGRTTLGVQGMATQMAARGHAQLGEGQAARSLLGEAENLIKSAAERPDDEPPWMYFYGEGWFLMQRGMAELELGDGRRAVPFLERGLSELPESYRRDRAWYGACLAHAHATAGEAEAAAEVALGIVPDAVAVNAYAVRDLRKVVKLLDRMRAPGARDLEDALPMSA
ncbi:helix-turn-helix transcriptional regulator [Streptosporangium sp. NPDC051022]|uniref:helix-turn-helix domain-containing protein n=1 Tax=Streptosporangium sp. NPDC051022 TaxID=3155752 RepID=UPI00344825C9